jgi:TnpA family transposase
MVRARPDDLHPYLGPVWAISHKLVNVGVRDSTYVLDGLLHHESDLRIKEHYTDTNGFTDHVFALMHLLRVPIRAPHSRSCGNKAVYPR